MYHFRDKNGLECDAVIHLRDGRYGLAEIELGGYELIYEGAASLLKLAGKIDTERMKAPSFMMVLVGVGTHISGGLRPHCCGLSPEEARSLPRRATGAQVGADLGAGPCLAPAAPGPGVIAAR